MAHELAGAFQQALGIRNLSATKKSDVNVSFESIHISESRVAHTCGRMAIMQYFSHVIAAAAHDFKPAPSDRPQFIRMVMHPALDSRISLDRGREPE